MKPVAIVDGQRVEVESVGYCDNQPYSVMVKPNYKTHYLTNSNVSLVWEDRYAPIEESIRKKIDAYEERMNDLAIQYIESKLPFSDSLRNQYQQLKDQVEGLIEALGLVVEVSEQIQNEKLEVI